MPDNSEFKTAAAKLLAQHSARKKESPMPAPKPVAQQQPVVWNTTEAQPRRVSSAGAELSSLIKGTAIPALAVLGCVIMVFLVPETIFGMWFNVVFGIVAGAFFGYMLIREL